MSWGTQVGSVSTDAGPAPGRSAAPGDARGRSPIGFDTARSVAGTLADTARLEQVGPLEAFRASKKQFESRTGLACGFDNNTQHLGTNSKKSHLPTRRQAFFGSEDGHA
jgi:hypothetical protein